MRGAAESRRGPNVQVSDGDGTVLLEKVKETRGERTELKERRGARMRGWNVAEAGLNCPAWTENRSFSETHLNATPPKA